MKMVKVYAVHLQKVKIEPEWLTLVSAPKRRRLARIHDSLSLAQSLVGDLLVRFLAVQHLEVSNRNLLFKTTDLGKPYLANPSHSFHFNLSHSGHWVMCAVDQSPVGIDVQQMEPIDHNLARNILTPPAYRRYLELLPERRLEYFYDLWTLRESRQKLTGQGMTVPLDLPVNQHENVPLCYRRYEFDPAYRMAVCALSNELEPVLFFVDVVSMIQQLSEYQ